MISTRFNVDCRHAQTRGPKSNQRPGKQTEMANAHINELGHWPSKAATKRELDNAGSNCWLLTAACCLPLVNNSTYHRRILDWKTQRRTHPAPQARINKNTFEWRCPLSVLAVPIAVRFPVQRWNLLRRCSCLSVEGGSASTWSTAQATLFKWKPRAHFKSKVSAPLTALREGCLRFELCIWLWVWVAASCSLSTLPLFKM